MNVLSVDNSVQPLTVNAQPVDRDHGAGESFSAQLREQAELFVSTAFLTPIMKMVRDDPFRSPLFHGGAGERIFGAQLDERMADNMVNRFAGPIVDMIYDTFAARYGKELDTHG